MGEIGRKKTEMRDAGNARTEAVRGKRETRDTLLRKNPRKRRGWRQRFNFSVIARQVWRVPDSTLSTRRPLHSLVLDRRNRHSAELRFSLRSFPTHSASSPLRFFLFLASDESSIFCARMQDRFRCIFIPSERIEPWDEGWPKIQLFL